MLPMRKENLEVFYILKNCNISAKQQDFGFSERIFFPVPSIIM